MEEESTLGPVSHIFDLIYAKLDQHFLEKQVLAKVPAYTCERILQKLGMVCCFNDHEWRRDDHLIGQGDDEPVAPPLDQYVKNEIELAKRILVEKQTMDEAGI